jgi:hypothetical protein
MASSADFSLTHSQFNEFLFADVGEQENGMMVSVFSALSRLGVDPWREAKRLSELPVDRAAQALDELIGKLAEGRWPKSDSLKIAARLIGLLPSHNTDPAPAADERATPFRPAATPLDRLRLLSGKTPPASLILWLTAIVLLTGLLYFMSASPDRSWNEDPGLTRSQKAAPRD